MNVKLYREKLTRNWCAKRVCISGESVQTEADRIVTLNTAICVLSTRSWARVDTLLPDARLVAGAVCVDNTLGSTVRRSSQVFR